MSDINNGGSSSNNNWLGFSLSPHMKMESSSSSSQQQHYLNAYPPSSFFSGDYEVPGTSLSVMPLKSDGSLCLMEALYKSNPPQGMVSSGSPKLEDFLGNRTTMGLNLDNTLYYQNAAAEQHYYSGLTALQSHGDSMLGSDQIGDLKSWLARQINHPGAANMVDHQQDGAAGDLQSLTLSMSPGSQSSCITAPGTEAAAAAMESKKRGAGKYPEKQPVHRKSIDTFGQRTSQYRGVTRHRWTGRYEAHLWDNSCKKEGQTRKGRQVYLGGYDMEVKAARAYDLAALKYWGPSTHINFPLENYQTELEEMKNMSRQEHVAHLRRKSSGFSRGASMYRGVTRHHQHGRWQARIGRVAGNKDLYLGTFSTQEEAAEAYDVAAIKFRGVNAVTNFDMTRYDVERILASNTLLAGDLARRNNEAEASKEIVVQSREGFEEANEVHDEIVNVNANANVSDWKMALYQSQHHVESVALDHTSSCDRTSSFPMGLGLDSDKSREEEPSNGPSSASLVSSLSSSSKEGSPPDKAMFFAKPPLATSWFPTLSMSHFPVFAAWNDA